MASGAGTGSSSPCGACKFLRRKCATNCIFAPYFCSEQGPARFAAIHKVFGASNVSKLLMHIPAHNRCEAVVAIAYEAQARIRDPVYGCVSHIFSLHQQVACLQAQLMQVKAQLVQNRSVVESRNIENQWSANATSMPVNTGTLSHNHKNSLSPRRSYESIDHLINDRMISSRQEMHSGEESLFQPGFQKKIPYNNDVGELEALALRMMRN